MTDASQTAGGHVAPHLLDEAVGWAVRMGSGNADASVHEACRAWRAAQPSHEAAWQQVQAVEDAFRQVPAMGVSSGALAHGALQAATQARRHGRRRTLGLMGLALTGGVLGLLAWRETPWLDQAVYATVVGERRRVLLADGTELHLNTGSEVQVVFSPLKRRILLHRGELFVRTGDDAGALFGKRSFWVEAAQARFEALGTRFGVRQTDGETRLSLAEGRVAIHAGTATAVVAQAGQGYSIRAGTALPQPIVDHSFDVDAWTDGALVAKQMRLDAFVAELARYRNAPLRCAPDIAALQVSGVFQLGGPDPVGHALDAVARTLPVKLERGETDTWTLSRR